HAACVKVADLLFVGTRGRLLVGGGGFEDAAQRLGIRFIQPVRYAPGAESRRNRILLEPAAVDVLVEILARCATFIQVAAVKAAARCAILPNRSGGEHE